MTISLLNTSITSEFVIISLNYVLTSKQIDFLSFIIISLNGILMFLKLKIQKKGKNVTKINLSLVDFFVKSLPLKSFLCS